MKNHKAPERPVLKRRAFIKYAGASAGIAALIITGCDDDKDKNPRLHEKASAKVFGNLKTE